MGLGGLLGDAYSAAKKVAGAINMDSLAPDAVKALYAPVGLGVDLATNVVQDNVHLRDLLSDMTKATEHRVGQSLAPVGDVLTGDVMPVGGAVGDAYNAVRNPITRAESTLFLTGNPSIGWSPLDAWKAAKDISPGQAFVSSAFGNLPGVHGHGFLNSNFDLADPEQRKAFNRGFGKFSSGAVDGYLSFTVGPDVVAAKALAGKRLALTGETGLKKFGVVDTSHFVPPPAPAEPLKLGGGREVARGRNLKPLTPTDPDEVMGRSSVTRVVEHLGSLNPNERALAVSRMKSFRGAVGLQHVIVNMAPKDGTSVTDGIRMAIRYAIDPTEANRSQLAEISAAATNKVNTLRDVRIPALERTLKMVQGGSDDVMALSEPGLIADLKTANQQLDAANRELTLAKAGESSAGSLTQAPRLTMAEHSLAGSSWDVVQPTRYGVATRVLRSAGTGRVSIVDLNRPGHAVNAAKVMLDRVGHGWGGGIDPIAKGRLLARVQAAEIDGPAAVHNALRDVEDAAFGWYGEKMGLGLEKTKGIVEAAAERRARAQGHLFGGDGPAYSGLYSDETGRWLDLLDSPSAGSKVRSAITTSQFLDKMPLIDIDEIARAVRLHKDELSESDWANLLSKFRGGSIDHADLSGVGIEMLEKFNRIWKPLQLLRLGWPTRVITDENLRIMATLGAMSHLPLAAASVVRGVGESRPAYRVRDALTSIERKRARENLPFFNERAAAEKNRVGLVNLISDATRMRGEHDAAIEATQAELDKLLGDDAPFIYRNAAATSRHATTGPGATFTLNPQTPVGEDVTHTRRMTLDDSRVYRPKTTGDTDAGIAALRDMVRPEEFTRLSNLPNKQLAALIRKEGGFAVAGNKSSMLSAYGAVVARRNGYNAIAHGEQFTALADDALRVGDEETHHLAIDRAAAKLDDLMDDRAALDSHVRQLTGKEQAQPRWHPDWNDELAHAIENAVSPSQMRRIEGPRAKFSGMVRVTMPDGTTRLVPDAFAGRHGRIYFDLSSSNSAARALAGAQDRHVNELRRRMGEVTTVPPTPPQGELNPDRIKTHQESYDKGWETAVNDQLGQNPTARQILSGMSDDEVIHWLRTTPAGREERRLIGYRGNDVHRWVGEIRQQVDGYLPTPELRAAAMEQRATADMLKTAIPDPFTRPTIHGESLEAALGKGEGHRIVNGMVDKMFKYLGTVPTDTLSRHPYFANVYRRSMQRQVQGLGLGPDAVLDEAMIERMTRRAREEALAKTKAVLYDTANESHLGHTLRFVAPFYNAWQEALTVWGKIFLDDPATLTRSMQLWNAPAKAHYTYTNPNGQKEIIVPLPDWAKDHLGVGRVGVPANFLPSLIASGSYPYLPGFGAPVSVPVSAFVRDHPDKIDMVKPLIPYGAGNSITDQILPAGLKHLLSWQKGTDDVTYAQDWTRNVMDLETEQREGKGRHYNSRDELIAEAKRRTDRFGGLRVLASFTLPFSPDFKSPYQFYIDQARTMRTLYQTYPGGKDAKGLSWDEAYLANFGEDFAAFTQSATKSNVGGIAPTEEGYRATKKYADLIRQQPQWGGLIVGNEDDGSLSSEVMHWQERTAVGGGDTRRMREVRDPKQAIIDSETSQGWDMFRRLDTAITNDLATRGLHSITQSGAEDLQVMKNLAVTAIKAKFPAWGDPTNKNGYDTFTKGTADALVNYLQTGGKGGTPLVDDPRFKGRAGWTTLAQYLSMRDAFETELKGRDAAGGSANLQARENIDLKVAWDLAVGALKQRDTAFSDIYTRWLSNDTLQGAA